MRKGAAKRAQNKMGDRGGGVPLSRATHRRIEKERNADGPREKAREKKGRDRSKILKEEARTRV